MKRHRLWLFACVMANIAVVAAAQGSADEPSIKSLQEMDAACETLRHAIWDHYDSSRINGEDLRQRTMAEDIADWVMSPETRAQLDALRAGIDSGNPKAMSDAAAILALQTRRLMAIDTYWSHAWYVRRQRALWMYWADLLPASITHDGRERIQELEQAAMHGFNPDAEMTPEAFKPLQDLLLAYDEERRKLSDPANAALQAQHIEQTVFDRDIPCEDNGPIKVDDSQPHPARVLKIPSLELYYPPEARHALSSGRVRVRADVDAAGCVVRSELIASAGDPVLDAAALRFAEHVDLRPATQDGVPVAVSVALPVNFVLRDPGVH